MEKKPLRFLFPFPFLRVNGGGCRGACGAGEYGAQLPYPRDQQLHPWRQPFFAQTPPPHYQRPETNTASPSFRAVIAAPPWWKEGSALERVEAAMAARKALVPAGERAGYDGISSDTDGAQGMRTSSLGVRGKRRKLDGTGAQSLLSKKARRQLEKTIDPSTLSLREDKLQEYFATWMAHCRQLSVERALDLMIGYYRLEATFNQKNQMKKSFTEYPALGLLNYSVRSMGALVLCSLLKLSIPESMKPGISATIDDVIRRTVEYFESNGVTGPESISLKRLHDCEEWVTSQFSSEQFSGLGHGTFLEFWKQIIIISLLT
uniref:Uncharacterized protein n=1 Tax=Leersia perrieri TaxID=77586 RepID=A0A0D9XD18_9ORYZ